MRKSAIHLITFASPDMSRSANLCVESAKQQSCDTAKGWVIPYLKQFSSYRSDWTGNRGFGWWHWKPIIIEQALHEHLTDDIVIYSDAGVEFINNVNHIIDRMDQDIFLFGNMYDHKDWCKRDIIEAVWPLTLDDMNADPATDDDSLTFGEWWASAGWARFSKQVQASVIFFRVNDTTRAFVKEWLNWCLFEGGRLIDDSPSRLPNHPEFQENRHDQAILTTMAYREGLKLHYWPASYNDGAFTYPRGDYPDERTPILFNHHRRRNHEWSNAA